MAYERYFAFKNTFSLLETETGFSMYAHGSCQFFRGSQAESLENLFPDLPKYGIIT